MCGIAGILRVTGPGVTPPPPERAIPESWLDTLDAAVRHRGPDGRGRFRQRVRRASGAIADVALVHRRLSIIDHGGGAQPMLHGRVPGAPADTPSLLFHAVPGARVEYRPVPAPALAVVFNGCIYNHRELRSELRGLGLEFVADHADTEVIPAAFAAWGHGAMCRLDGMFAVGLWDARAGEVVLARDTAGEKPLYAVRAAAGLWAFASTFAALVSWLRVAGRHEAGVEGLRPNVPGVLEWLRFGASLRSPLLPLEEVPPRTVVRLGAQEDGTDGAGASVPARFRELPGRRHGTGILTIDQADRAISDAVTSRLEADVPIGCFLSGGVDSSLVALHARRALGSLRTFTVRMPDARYDESAFAARVAGLLDTRHETLDCDARPAEQLPALITQLGLPLGDSSLLPTHWVSRAAGGQVKVALCGDGGDELFAGYERHVAARLLARWRTLLRTLPSGVGAAAHPKSRRSKFARLIQAARFGYNDLLSIFPARQMAALVPGWEAEAVGDGVGVDAPRADFEHSLPADLMRKSDTASMAVPVEVRSPLLARCVVDAAMAASLRDLMPKGRRKGLLRALARRALPDDLVDRPKMGFAIPVGKWVRSDFGGLGGLVRDSLGGADPLPASVLGVEVDLSRVRRMVAAHLEGREEHGQRLYHLAVLAVWAGWVRSGA
jgi:asparagine synthase (glutamine-hydrolysing)